MKYLIAFLLSLSLPAWSQQYNITFEAKEDLPEILIRWTVVSDADTICRFRGAQAKRTMKACAIYNGKTCEIITNKVLDMAVLGHEIRHCFEGRWHD